MNLPSWLTTDEDKNDVLKECCSEEFPCGYGQGDCDMDSECEGSLKCGNDNCVGSSNVDIVFGSHFDCCYPGLSIKEKDANTEIIFFFYSF